jgi:hypothetical protein
MAKSKKQKTKKKLKKPHDISLNSLNKFKGFINSQLIYLIICIIIILLFIISYTRIIYDNVDINKIIFKIISFICIITILVFLLTSNFIHTVVLTIFLIYVIYIYLDTYYIISNCSKDPKAMELFIVYSLLTLSVYLFMNQKKKLADCTYGYFSKLVLYIVLVLTLVYNFTELFIITIFLLIRFSYVESPNN